MAEVCFFSVVWGKKRTGQRRTGAIWPAKNVASEVTTIAKQTHFFGNIDPSRTLLPGSHGRALLMQDEDAVPSAQRERELSSGGRRLISRYATTPWTTAERKETVVRDRYHAVGMVPPSITNSVPVMQAARGETRKPTSSATSAGFDGRPIGMPPSEAMSPS